MQKLKEQQQEIAQKISFLISQTISFTVTETVTYSPQNDDNAAIGMNC
jgi:hypothetical protein